MCFLILMMCCKILADPLTAHQHYLNGQYEKAYASYGNGKKHETSRDCLKQEVEFLLCENGYQQRAFDRMNQYCGLVMLVPVACNNRVYKKKTTNFMKKIFMEAYAVESFDSSSAKIRYTTLMHVFGPKHSLGIEAKQRMVMLQGAVE